MRQESDFDPGATSNSGCKGLLQVSPGTQPDTGVSGDLYQPSVSIDAGTSYIKKMLDAAHGDVHKALLCYNASPGAATDGAVPAGQDSTAGQYATAVEGWYNDLKTKGEVNTALGSKPGS